ncbi:hypothetical protein AB0E27_18660 [Streptomyces sparsogenes]|uniref:hypothetical protein n=1 Tax=Streptomyces sparsogenes TaxID=67365 RepID=UPI0033EC23EF
MLIRPLLGAAAVLLVAGTSAPAPARSAGRVADPPPAARVRVRPRPDPLTADRTRYFTGVGRMAPTGAVRRGAEGAPPRRVFPPAGLARRALRRGLAGAAALPQVMARSRRRIALLTGRA